MPRIFCLFLFTATAFAQNATPEAQVLQALLTEIRQLRQDLQITAVTIQRVQIVMYRLQAESSLMARATQRLEEARDRCSQLQNQKKGLTAEVERNEERQRNTQDPKERMAANEMISRLKTNLEMVAAQEQSCQTREADAETQFRSEQGRFNELQDQMEKLDKVLAGFSGK